MLHNQDGGKADESNGERRQGEQIASVGLFPAPPLPKMRHRDDDGKLRRLPQPEEIPLGLSATIARPVWRSRLRVAAANPRESHQN